jgi:hypothetical protein
MTTNLSINDQHVLVCKHLSELPPVVSDWQQSCKRPRCPHYRQGECHNPGRERADAPCPFDGEELLLEDADDTGEDRAVGVSSMATSRRPGANTGSTADSKPAAMKAVLQPQAPMVW